MCEETKNAIQKAVKQHPINSKVGIIIYSESLYSKGKTVSFTVMKNELSGPRYLVSKRLIQEGDHWRITRRSRKEGIWTGTIEEYSQTFFKPVTKIAAIYKIRKSFRCLIS